MSNKILSVIPAREGSKGIPRKNIRSLDGIPLIAHAIETSQNSNRVDTTVLTTDSTEAQNIGRKFGVDEIIDRPARLCTDEVPLAPVIKHAQDRIDGDFEYVLSFQPTAPLISPESLDEGIETAFSEESNSLIFVRDSTHLYWRAGEEGLEPVSPNRLNRQELEPIYQEIGLFVSHSSLVNGGKRVGRNPSFYIVPKTEGVDIDSYDDWIVAERNLNSKNVKYRVTGHTETGTGHAYRGITIADHVFNHNIEFLVTQEDNLAINILEDTNYQYRIIKSNSEVESILENEVVDVVINDILDTTRDYISGLQKHDVRVVNIEDLGPGRNVADAVVNSLYEHSNPPENHYYGFKYFCLRDEFRHASPKSSIESVDRIMISFGGTDENNLTARTLNSLDEVDSKLDIDVVLGPGYTKRHTIDQIIASLGEDRTTVSQDINTMSEHMQEADLLVTSNGRTIYEGASLNLPMVSIAQNERELRHPYSYISNGVMSLGHASQVSIRKLQEAIEDYINSQEKRYSMQQSLSNHSISNGIEEVKEIVFDSENYE